jgi:hypothetical protein
VQNAPTINGVAGFPDPVVVEMQVDYMAVTATTAAKAGEYGFAVAGTAGIKGSAKLVKVAPTGTSSNVSGKLTKLVNVLQRARHCQASSFQKTLQVTHLLLLPQ